MRRLPTDGELDACGDVLEKLAEKYSLILKAEGTDVVPTIIGDWHSWWDSAYQRPRPR